MLTCMRRLHTSTRIDFTKANANEERSSYLGSEEGKKKNSPCPNMLCKHIGKEERPDFPSQ